MRIPTRLALAPAAFTIAMLALSGCAPASHDSVDTEEIDVVAPDEVDANPVDDETDGETRDASTRGLSKEAIDSGYTAVAMPSGWPGELPLPDGTVVSAFRSGKNFALVFDLRSIAAGEKILDWYEASDWVLADDIETEGIRVMSFESAESNDYGPLRRVTLGLGMVDWPTGFQYSLEVRE